MALVIFGGTHILFQKCYECTMLIFHLVLPHRRAVHSGMRKKEKKKKKLVLCTSEKSLVLYLINEMNRELGNNLKKT